MERVMGFEPTTFCLGSKHSTPELHPLNVLRFYITIGKLTTDHTGE